MTKFKVGTKVKCNGYRGVISGLRTCRGDKYPAQRYVRLGSGQVVVDARELKYWKKNKK